MFENKLKRCLVAINFLPFYLSTSPSLVLDQLVSLTRKMKKKRSRSRAECAGIKRYWQCVEGNS